MTGTRVVHVADNVPGAVYVGRANARKRLKGSPFANPFKIGDTLPTFEGRDDRQATRRDVLIQYELWIKAYPQRGLMARLPELRGKPLACWCRHDGDASPEEVCHADILARLLAMYDDDELRNWS